MAGLEMAPVPEIERRHMWTVNNISKWKACPAAQQ